MVSLSKSYNPLFFDLEELKVINSSFYQIYYKGEDKFERVQKESRNGLSKDAFYFKNNERIAEDNFSINGEKVFKLEKNRSSFITGNHIAHLDIYFKPNHEILPVVRLEFSNERELEEFKPEKWFGKEVSNKFYNERNIWNTFKSLNWS